MLEFERPYYGVIKYKTPVNCDFVQVCKGMIFEKEEIFYYSWGKVYFNFLQETHTISLGFLAPETTKEKYPPLFILLTKMMFDINRNKNDVSFDIDNAKFYNRNEFIKDNFQLVGHCYDEPLLESLIKKLKGK